MKKQFADYETSKILKELGFDEKCLAYYNSLGSNRKLKPIDTDFKNFRDIGIQLIKVPLWSQVEQWLWEKHQILISVNHRGEGVFCPYISFTKKGEGVLCIREENPIDAKIKGIKEAVEYLKITK